MSASKADELLEEASGEPDRLRRHLLVAAALREILPSEPVVEEEEPPVGRSMHRIDLKIRARARDALTEL